LASKSLRESAFFSASSKLIQAMERIINMFPHVQHKQLFMDLAINLNAVISQRNSYIASYAPASAPCSRQKSAHYKFRTRSRAKYSLEMGVL
jgi:hypothetical protein